MRSAFLSAIVLYLLVLGISYPFVAGMAYLWIDIAKPQSLAYSLIEALPLSLIAGIFVILSLVFNRNKKPFTIHPVQVLIGLFAIWITITTYLADPMLNSWGKWDPSFKALIFTLLIPMLFRSRVQIEAYLLTIIFSLATIVFSAGVKTLMGGGGYGVLAVLGGTNTGMAESSTLAAVALMMLPLIHYVYNNSLIFPDNRILKWLLLAAGITAMAAVVGSSARTGLVAGAILLMLYVLRSNYKLVWTVVLLVALGIAAVLDLEGSTWGQRMTTINTYNEDASATGRIDVWKWTLKFVADHPLGGGFDAYRFNGIGLPNSSPNAYSSNPSVIGGKAFHSIYFEVLGEQGFPGVLLYFSAMLLTFSKLGKIKRFTKGKPMLAWANDLAVRTSDSQTVLMVSGLFIGIAFQPVMFYLVALTLCMSDVVFAEVPKPLIARNNAKEHTPA